MIEVHYETPDGIDTLSRNVVDTQDGLLVCYDNPENVAGIQNRVDIPLHRVIEIEH